MADNLGNTFWAYVAGLMDGEGCIRIQKPRKTHRGSQLQISLGSTNKQVILWLKEKLGGSVSFYSSRAYKNFCLWGVCTKDAQYLLENILPYLIIKKEQAILALEFRRTFSQKHKRNTLHLEIQKYRNVLTDIVKSLKREVTYR